MTASATPNNLSHERLNLRGDGKDVQRAQDALAASLNRFDYDDSSRFAIRLALEEALTNAIKHGSQSRPEKHIEVAYHVDDSVVRIEILDEGHGFDPDAVPDPTQDENLEIPAGRGIVLMRSFMSEVQYQPPGNRVTMTYHRPRPRN